MKLGYHQHRGYLEDYVPKKREESTKYETLVAIFGKLFFILLLLCTCIIVVVLKNHDFSK